MNIISYLSDAVQKMNSVASGFFQKIHYYRNVYRSQVANARNPFSSCFPTCAAWFLHEAGYPLENADDIQSVLNSAKYQEWVIKRWDQKTAVEFLGKYHILWEVEQDYINCKLDGRRAVFSDRTTIEDIKLALQMRKSPVIVGTSPRYRGQVLGHIMMIVGYVPLEEQWIVDDPFGDFRMGYATGHDQGNDLVISISEFEKIRGKCSICMEA